MNYFKDLISGEVYFYDNAQIASGVVIDGLVLMTEEEIDLHLNPPPTPNQLIAIEDQWREEQMIRIANQLLMIEDEDPEAESGTARQWRDYRIALRAWVQGREGFPASINRPVSPA